MSKNLYTGINILPLSGDTNPFTVDTNLFTVNNTGTTTTGAVRAGNDIEIKSQSNFGTIGKPGHALTDYALLFAAGQPTVLNAESGQDIGFRINNSVKYTIKDSNGALEGNTGFGFKIGAYQNLYGLGIQSGTLQSIIPVGASQFTWNVGVSSVNTQVMTLLDSGELGLGVSSPGAKFVVQGLRDDSAGDTFLLTDSGGTTNFVVEDGGNVGIGTAAPGRKLHVTGEVFGTGRAQFGPSTWQSNDGLTVDNGASTSFNFLTLSNSGSVKAQIGRDGYSSFGSSLTANVFHNITTENSSLNWDDALFITQDSISDGSNPARGINIVHTGPSSATSANIGVQIDVSGHVSGDTHNLAIIVPSGGGRVGIGTSAPTSQFHVVGDTDVTGGGAILSGGTDLYSIFSSAGSGGISKFASSSAFTANTGLQIDHNLGTTDVTVQLKNAAGTLVIPNIVDNYQTNSVDIEMASTETYRVIITG